MSDWSSPLSPCAVFVLLANPLIARTAHRVCLLRRLPTRECLRFGADPLPSLRAVERTEHRPTFTLKHIVDLLGIAPEKINEQRLYRALDAILPHKEPQRNDLTNERAGARASRPLRGKAVGTPAYPGIAQTFLSVAALHFPGWLRKTNVPFLLPTITSATPSPLRSTAVTWVPTPELSSISCGMNRTPWSLSRRNSNQ